jgi:ABC-type glycerol-3-phosphate transport system permease component
MVWPTSRIAAAPEPSRERLELGRLFAAATVAVAPLVILFLILQRHIMEGAKFSGVKG